MSLASSYSALSLGDPLSSSTASSDPRRSSSRSSSKKKSQSYDRLLPDRTGFDVSLAHQRLLREINAEEEQLGAGGNTELEEYHQILNTNLLGKASRTSSVLGLTSSSREKDEREMVLNSQRPSHRVEEKKKPRVIPQVPNRTLDAPNLIDDFYLNLLSWGPDNVLAIALGNLVYLWNGATSSITELVSLQDEEHVCSLSWAEEGRYLAVGTSEGAVQIWDAEAERQLRNMTGHTARVSSLAWNHQSLSTGARDCNIINFDVSLPRPITNTLTNHQGEVCGLEWNKDKTMLASGGNDNMLMIWDAAMMDQPRLSFDQHKAAVKALAWNPYERDLLASGGGTADKHIRMWNCSSGECLQAVDTKSQVCSIKWSTNYPREFVSSHGYCFNQLIVWSYPRMKKLAELKGHSSRVLHLAVSPDGETVASAAGDETLRFWRIFERSKSSSDPLKSSSSSSSSSSRSSSASRSFLSIR